MHVLIVVAVAAMVSVPAFAEPSKIPTFVSQDEVDVSFAASRSRLRADGYRSVKRVNGDPLWLKAFDSEGSEVVLRISPQTGEIDGSHYVHPMDE